MVSEVTRRPIDVLSKGNQDDIHGIMRSKLKKRETIYIYIYIYIYIPVDTYTALTWFRVRKIISVSTRHSKKSRNSILEVCPVDKSVHWGIHSCRDVRISRSATISYFSICSVVAGSNPAWRMDIYPFFLCCLVMAEVMRQADASSKESYCERRNTNWIGQLLVYSSC
jgi:hypothetical protein